MPKNLNNANVVDTDSDSDSSNVSIQQPIKLLEPSTSKQTNEKKRQRSPKTVKPAKRNKKAKVDEVEVSDDEGFDIVENTDFQETNKKEVLKNPCRSGKINFDIFY